MKLALIHTSTPEKLEKIINFIKEMDVNLYHFESISNFVSSQETRFTDFDRILLFESVFSTNGTAQETEETMRMFYGFLCAQYPETRVVIVASTEEYAKYLNDIFISSSMIILLPVRLKYDALHSIVSDSIDLLKAGTLVYNPETESTEEVAVTPQSSKEQKKKKGFLSIFAKKSKQTKEVVQEESEAPAAFPVLEEESFDSVGDLGSGVDWEESSDNTWGSESPWSSEESEESGGLEFVSDGVDVGLGVPVNLEKETDWGEEVSEDSWGQFDEEPTEEVDDGTRDNVSDGFPEGESGVLTDGVSEESLGDVGLGEADSFSSDFGSLSEGSFAFDEGAKDFSVYGESEDEDQLQDRSDEDETWGDLGVEEETEPSSDLSNSEVEEQVDEETSWSSEEGSNSDTFVTGGNEGVTSNDANLDLWRHYGTSEHSEEEESGNGQSVSVDYEERKQRLSQIADISHLPKIDRSPLPPTSFSPLPSEPIADAPLGDDLPIEVVADLEAKVAEYKKNANTVIVEKIVTTGRRSRSMVKFIIVSGDRRSGVTSTALSLAKIYAKTETVLFVDMDLKRKGSLLYLGLNGVLNQPPQVQEGLSRLRTLPLLSSLTYPYLKGGFDCLLSVYGSVFEEEQLRGIENLLSAQRQYQTVVVDCPLENLHLMEDMLPYADILICLETDLPSTMSTILTLAEVFETDKLQIYLRNNSKYYLPKTSDSTKHYANLKFISDLFDLNGTETDWTSIPLIGVAGEVTKVASQL